MNESTKRVREMQLLGLVLDQSDKLKLDHTSIRRIGKYLINLANNEHAELVRDGAQIEIGNRIVATSKIIEKTFDPEIKIKIIDQELQMIHSAHVRWLEAVKTV